MTIYEKCDLIIAAVAAFFTTLAIIWALFKETIFAFWKRPILQKRFSMDMPYIARLHESVGLVYYYHLGIKNIGKSTALNCRAYIDAIYEYSNGQYQRMKNFMAMPLYWAREGRLDTFIGPEQEKFLDLGTITTRVHYGEEGVPFELEFKEFSDINRIYPGKYKIKIILYSENAKSLATHLYIIWSGQRKDQYSEMLKEFIISDKERCC